jgi:hypothetical protein
LLTEQPLPVILSERADGDQQKKIAIKTRKTAFVFIA